MARKRRDKRQEDINGLGLALVQNGRAMEDGRKIKNWTKHDIKAIKPLTPTQEEAFQSWYNDNHLCLHGSAGTGKTFIGLYLALNEVLAKRQSKIIILRSAVATRDVGFLPGTLEEKMAQYETPYQDILAELFGKNSTYTDMKDAGLIEFMSTSFIRGLTWDNVIVVVDEGENMTFHEIDSAMTRLGENSRIIFTGDILQTDLDGKKHGVSGMSDALNVFKNISDFDCVKFTVHDIVRSNFVKTWITATEDTFKRHTN